MKRLSKVDKVLLDAANLIEQYDWCAGTLQDKKGRYCLMGGIYSAAGVITKPGGFRSFKINTRQYLLREGAIKKLGKYLGPEIGNEGNILSDLYDWNDSYASKDKVIDALVGAVYWK